MKIGIDVRFHKSRDRDRKRLITITANSTDMATREDAISASTASEQPAWRHNEGHNDAGGDDDASAIPSTTTDPPTARGGLPRTADAAEAAAAQKSELPKAPAPDVTPKASDGADGGIKNHSIEFVSHRVIGGRRIPILRHRRHGKPKTPRAFKHPEKAVQRAAVTGEPEKRLENIRSRDK
jgi:hypothetical protein